MEAAIIFSVLVVWGTIWFLLGIRIFVKIDQFKKYSFIIGTSSENILENICNSTGHSKRKVEKNIAYMIKKKYFITKSSGKKEETLMEFFGVEDEDEDEDNCGGDVKKEVTMDDIDFLLVYENEVRKTLRLFISEMLMLIGAMGGGLFPIIELLVSYEEQNGKLTAKTVLLCAGAFAIGALLFFIGIIRMIFSVRYIKYRRALFKHPEGFIKDLAKELDKDELVVLKDIKTYLKKGFFYNARFDEDDKRIIVKFMAERFRINKLGMKDWEKVADMTVERCPHCGNLNYILIGITKRCSECGERL